jgi:hypothetical protein
MRETRLSGSEGGAGSIPVPTPIAAEIARERRRGSASELEADAKEIARERRRGSASELAA